MKKLWNRETLRYVDAWACREGTPEDTEDERAQSSHEMQGSDGVTREKEKEVV